MPRAEEPNNQIIRRLLEFVGATSDQQQKPSDSNKFEIEKKTLC